MILQSAVGAVLESVRYVGMPWEGAPKRDDPVDAVSRAVIFEFEKARIQFRWDLRPPVEALAVEAPTDWSLTQPVKIFDASARWGDLVGCALETFVVGYHHVASGRERWAVLLEFGGERNVMVALGELVEGLPTYLPDSLVITADPAIVNGYRPMASEIFRPG